MIATQAVHAAGHLPIPSARYVFNRDEPCEMSRFSASYLVMIVDSNIYIISSGISPSSPGLR
jgi:hypothetical protein